MFKTFTKIIFICIFLFSLVRCGSDDTKPTDNNATTGIGKISIIGVEFEDFGYTSKIWKSDGKEFSNYDFNSYATIGILQYSNNFLYLGGWNDGKYCYWKYDGNAFQKKDIVATSSNYSIDEFYVENENVYLVMSNEHLSVPIPILVKDTGGVVSIYNIETTQTSYFRITGLVVKNSVAYMSGNYPISGTYYTSTAHYWTENAGIVNQFILETTTSGTDCIGNFGDDIYIGGYINQSSSTSYNYSNCYWKISQGIVTRQNFETGTSTANLESINVIDNSVVYVGGSKYDYTSSSSSSSTYHSYIWKVEGSNVSATELPSEYSNTFIKSVVEQSDIYAISRSTQPDGTYHGEYYKVSSGNVTRNTICGSHPSQFFDIAVNH